MTETQQPRILPADFIETCDRRARRAICAQSWNPKTKQDEIVGFRFNPAIAHWPLCRQAEAEGWGKELRSAMIATLKRAFFAGANPDLSEVVPRPDWIEKTRERAAVYRAAEEWQTARIDENGTLDRWLAQHRPKNVGPAYSKGRSFTSLSDVTRRMTGDAA